MSLATLFLQLSCALHICRLTLCCCMVGWAEPNQPNLCSLGWPGPASEALVMPRPFPLFACEETGFTRSRGHASQEAALPAYELRLCSPTAAPWISRWLMRKRRASTCRYEQARFHCAGSNRSYCLFATNNGGFLRNWDRMWCRRAKTETGNRNHCNSILLFLHTQWLIIWLDISMWYIVIQSPVWTLSFPFLFNFFPDDPVQQSMWPLRLVKQWD